MKILLRVLAALVAAFVLSASGCEQTEINDEGFIVDSETGERIDADRDDPAIDSGDDASAAADTPDGAAEDAPSDDTEPEAEAAPSDDTEPEGEAASETPVTGPVELTLGGPVGEDALLNTVVLAEFDAEGHLVTTLDEELRDASWAGATLFLSFQGTDFELQCGANTGSGVCNNWGLPDFDCAGSSTFPDSGEGPITIVWPVRQGDGEMVIDLPPTDGCVDPFGAVVTGGFVFLIPPDGGGRSATFADGFESGDVSSWLPDGE